MADQARNGPEGGGDTMGDGGLSTRRNLPEASDLKRQAKDSVRGAQDKLKTQARTRTDAAKHRGTREIDTRKHELAESVTALATAIDSAAGSLSESEHGRLAGWTRELSGRARRLASYLEQTDTRGLVTDLEGTAREHPSAFAGSSFAAGLAAGRFLRSSKSRRESETLEGATSIGEPQVEFQPDARLSAATPTTTRGTVREGGLT